MLESIQGDMLLTLIAIILVELVLGMDNLIVLFGLFKKRKFSNKLLIIGLGFTFSVLLRILILSTALSLLQKTFPLFSLSSAIFEIDVGSRGLVFFVAGLYLITHAVAEIREYFDKDDLEDAEGILLSKMSWPYMILWIAVIDLVFSYDSLLGVIAISKDFGLLVTGLIISRVIMLFFFARIYRFINKHPELMVVMFIFLAMVGLSLFLEGLEDMETLVAGLQLRSFPVSWLYSIFAIGILYSWWHTARKRRLKKMQ